MIVNEGDIVGTGQHPSAMVLSSYLLFHRTAPTRQIIGLLALGQLQGAAQRAGKIARHALGLQAAAQKIGPEEFAVKRRVLGEAAGAA